MSKKVFQVVLITSELKNYLLLKTLLSQIETSEFVLEWTKIEPERQLISSRAAKDAYLIDLETNIEKLVSSLKPTPVIVLVDSDRAGRESLSCGAADYINKNSLTLSDLERSLRLTVKSAREIEKVQTALQETRENLSNMLERSTLGVAKADLSRKLLLVNEKMTDLLGYTAEELTQLKIEDITHPQDLELEIPLFEEIYSGKSSSFSCEKRYIRKDGGFIWVEVTVSVVRDPAKNSKHLIKVIRERKKAKELVKKRKWLQPIADRLPVGICYIDAQQRYQFANENYENWFGDKAEDICGKHPIDVIGERAYNCQRDKIERVLAGEQVTYEAQIPYKREGIRHVSITLVPDFDENANVRGCYALIVDISDRVSAQQKLQYRLTLETAFAEISRELAANDTADINQILEWLRVAESASGGHLIRFREEGTKADMIHQWCESQSQSQKYFDNCQNLDISLFPWWQKQLNEANNIAINTVETLPPEAKLEKDYLLSLKVNSLLAVPIYNKSGQLWGQIALTSNGNNNKKWCQQDSQLLAVVGNTIYCYYERKQAREKISASEALYADIFSHSADGIFLLNVLPDGDFIYEAINPAYQKAIGMAAEDVIGKRISQVLPLEMAVMEERIYHGCITKGVPNSYEKTLELPEGKRILLTTLVPIKDKSGKIIKLQGSARDITEEKQITAKQIRFTRYQRLLASLTLKIRQSWQIEEILETAVIEIQKTLNAERVLFFRLNSDGSGKVVHEAVVSQFTPIVDSPIVEDYCTLKFLSKYLQGDISCCADVLKAGYNPCYLEFLQQYQIRANLIVPIVMTSKQDTESETTQLHQTPLETTKQRLWGLLCVQQCSQPRQWTEEEIELLKQLADRLSIALYQAELIEKQDLQRQELVRSNAELEQFAYIASHDLQEPLQTVASYAKLLQRRYQNELDSKANKYIYYIVDGAKRMQRQINDLLEYSRIDKKNKSCELIDCNKIFSEAIGNLSSAIRQNQALVIAKDLPVLMADPSQMLQLFQNLIGNAIKYRSEEAPLIMVKAMQQKNYWLFSVRDNGIGIDAKYSKRIFQIFQRLHSQDEYPGTGIGLAICEKIVKHHGGRIWVDSQPQQGSTFYFTLAESAN
ncbi:MAG: PAS domain S-box protein [Prochloraceae cyanobacterium]|nr:PAS domain S-box protein [Prochloraceae cyanobacterium]